MVMAWPMPLWGLSGATTVTSPNSRATRTRVRIPGAVIPSSLQINMRGFLFMCRGLERGKDSNNRMCGGRGVMELVWGWVVGIMVVGGYWLLIFVNILQPFYHLKVKV